jgi:hypothetical protein
MPEVAHGEAVHAAWHASVAREAASRGVAEADVPPAPEEAGWFQSGHSRRTDGMRAPQPPDEARVATGKDEGVVRDVTPAKLPLPAAPTPLAAAAAAAEEEDAAAAAAAAAAADKEAEEDKEADVTEKAADAAAPAAPGVATAAAAEIVPAAAAPPPPAAAPPAAAPPAAPAPIARPPTPSAPSAAAPPAPRAAAPRAGAPPPKPSAAAAAGAPARRAPQPVPPLPEMRQSLFGASLIDWVGPFLAVLVGVISIKIFARTNGPEGAPTLPPARYFSPVNRVAGLSAKLYADIKGASRVRRGAGATRRAGARDRRMCVCAFSRVCALFGAVVDRKAPR